GQLADLLDQGGAAGEGHRRTQRDVGGHGRAAVQRDPHPDQVAVQVGAGEGGGGVRDVLQRDRPHLVGERRDGRVEQLHLLVGRRIIGVVGGGQVGVRHGGLADVVLPNRG